jgi:hypothetical protein
MKGLRDERENGYQWREKMGIVPSGKEKNESENISEEDGGNLGLQGG